MTSWYPIDTERLRLRDFEARDENDIHEYACDSEVVRFTSWGPNTPAMTEAVLAGWMKEQQAELRDSFALAIELKGENRLIGTIRLGLGNNRAADLGYALNRGYWGCGYMTEAAGALIGAAFRQLGLHRAWATCDTRNHASYRVMEKLGMRREALFRKDVMQRGEWRDSFVYAVLAEEWHRYEGFEPARV